MEQRRCLNGTEKLLAIPFHLKRIWVTVSDSQMKEQIIVTGESEEMPRLLPSPSESKFDIQQDGAKASVKGIGVVDALGSM